MNIIKFNHKKNSDKNSDLLNDRHNVMDNKNLFTNNAKVGRNEPTPVRTENGSYNIVSNKNLDESFTHSALSFNTTKIEEENLPDKIQIVKINGNSIIPEEIFTNEEIENESNNYNNKSKKKKRKKIIMKIVVIGIIVEVIAILIIGIIKYVLSSNSSSILSCKASNEENNDLKVEVTDLYYFNNSNNFKREITTKYVFANKESFNKYKSNYVDKGIYNISGLSYENSFNTSSLSYTNRVIYEYDKMKKDKNNKSSNKNKIIIMDLNGNTLFDIEISNMETLMSINKEQGYTCSIIKK